MKILILLACGFATGAAQTPAPNLASAQRLKTYGCSNGRMWMSMSDLSRLFYLGGFSDASASFPLGLTITEIRDAITRFYADPANVLIPTAAVLDIVNRKQKGATDAEIREFVSAARSLANDAPERKAEK